MRTQREHDVDSFFARLPDLDEVWAAGRRLDTVFDPLKGVLHRPLFDCDAGVGELRQVSLLACVPVGVTRGVLNSRVVADFGQSPVGCEVYQALRQSAD